MEQLEVFVHAHPEGRHFIWSYEIADAFSKRHADVLRSIDELIAQLTDTEHKRLFALRQRQMPIGFPVNGVQPMRQERCFAMTRDGFTLLAMGFTGKKALQFKLAYINKFNELEAQFHARVLSPVTPLVEATQEIARLARYTEVPVQIEAVKNVAGALVHHGSPAFDIINHHRAVMKALTGERPSAYVQHAVEEGLRVKGKSGRAVLRLREPEKAATAAVLDDSVRQGKTLEEAKAAGLIEALPGAFKAILSLGLKSADLEADKQAA